MKCLFFTWLSIYLHIFKDTAIFIYKCSNWVSLNCSSGMLLLISVDKLSQKPFWISTFYSDNYSQYFFKLTLFSLYFSLYPCLCQRDISAFIFSFSINFYQHNRFRQLEMVSLALFFSFSLSVSLNMHHICDDSQLACSVCTLTALGSYNHFPKICLNVYSRHCFFSFILFHCEWSMRPFIPAVRCWLTETQWHSCSGEVVSVY